MTKTDKTDLMGSTAYDLIIVINDRGGSRKSSTTKALGFLSQQAGHATLITETDQQRGVAETFGPAVLNITMPDVKTMSDSTSADTRALSGFFQRLRAHTKGQVHIVDTGANLSERLTHAITVARALRLAPDWLRICLVTPLDDQPETISLAARSITLWTAAMPQAHVVLVQPTSSLDVALPANSDIDCEYRRVIKPITKRMVFPTFSSDVLRAYKAHGGNLETLLTEDPETLGRASLPQTGSVTLTPDEAFWAGHQIQAEFELYVAHISQEVERELSFRFSNDSA